MADDATFPRFKTAEGRARYLAAYESALQDWPVAYDELDIEMALGPTHLIAGGPADAPPLILLHSLAGTGLVWRPNIATPRDESRAWRPERAKRPAASRTSIMRASAPSRAAATRPAWEHLPS